jgi:hypothetical protein
MAMCADGATRYGEKGALFHLLNVQKVHTWRVEFLSNWRTGCVTLAVDSTSLNELHTPLNN